MKIGVLGGSFDPPHNGHLLVAKSLIKQTLCDKVILMPCFKHPFGKPITDGKHRLAMTTLSIACQNDTRRITPNIEVSDLEIKKEKISYTIDTLNALKFQFPKDDFVWIIGEDQIKDFGKWKDWKEIVERFGLIVVPRNKRPEAQGLPTSDPAPPRWPNGLLGGGTTNKHLKSVALLHFNPLDISSSEIRQRIKQRLPITNLVPKEVERYIIKHKLYKTYPPRRSRGLCLATSEVTE